MKLSYGVVLDRRMVERRCRICLGYKTDEPTNSLFSYLEVQPNIGIITNLTEDYIKSKLWGSNQKRTEKCKQLLCEFDQMKEKFLRVEKIDYPVFQKNLENVTDFFNTLVGPEEPSFVSYKYKHLISSETKKSKFSFDVVDKKGLAEAVTLKSKYNSLFFASQNSKFSHPFVLNAIEEKFDITSGDASLILQEINKISKNEDLSNRKPISVTCGLSKHLEKQRNLIKKK